MHRLILACMAVVAVAGCGGATASSSAETLASAAASPSLPASGAPTGTGSPTSAPSGNVLQYVAFGDSWPAGQHCGGCRTFAGQWADGLEALTGRPVQFIDLTGSHERSLAESKGTFSLLQSLRNDAPTRAAVVDAAVILIATGPNEMVPVVNTIKAGSCGGADDADCIRALGERWRTNLDAILTEIASLRGGQPTVVRLVSAANIFVSEPGMFQDLPADFATGNGALIFKLLNDAKCAVAADHDAVCVDVRPILNGPSLEEPVNENAPASMQAVADALIATGIDELR